MQIKHIWTEEIPTASGLYIQHRDDSFFLVKVDITPKKQEFIAIEESDFDADTLAGEWLALALKREVEDKAIQLTRCYVALNLISGLLQIMPKEVEDKRSLEQLAKIKYWLDACSDSLERAPKHSASWRISDKLNKRIHLSVIEGTRKENITDGNGYAAWVYCIYCYLIEARACSKEFAIGKAWYFLEKTFATMADSLFAQYPKGGALGYTIYCQEAS